MPSILNHHPHVLLPRKAEPRSYISRRLHINRINHIITQRARFLARRERVAGLVLIVGYQKRRGRCEAAQSVPDIVSMGRFICKSQNGN